MCFKGALCDVQLACVRVVMLHEISQKHVFMPRDVSSWFAPFFGAAGRIIGMLTLIFFFKFDTVQWRSVAHLDWTVHNTVSNPWMAAAQ